MARPLVGLDVGGTKVLGVVIDPDAPGTPLAEHRAGTPATVEELVEVLVTTVTELQEACTALGPSPAAIGVGLPGVIDHDGVLRGAPNLRHAIDQPVRPALEARIGAPVWFGNDADCALWAEAQVGAGRGAQHLVLAALGTGIGGAVMVDGGLTRGMHGYAGEPGHMVVERDGIACPCGRRGCWERYASGAGLARIARDAARAGRATAVLARAGGDPEAIRGEHVGAAADAGDAEAVALFAEFAAWVAIGVGNLFNLLDPEMVILGGGLADRADHYLDEVRRLVPGEVLGAGAHRATRVVIAELGPSAGAIGAALLAGRAAHRVG